MLTTARALAGNDDDPLLAAVRRAPLVPLTEHERALLAEVQGRPVSWMSTDEVTPAASRT